MIDKIPKYFIAIYNNCYYNREKNKDYFLDLA